MFLSRLGFLLEGVCRRFFFVRMHDAELTVLLSCLLVYLLTYLLTYLLSHCCDPIYALSERAADGCNERAAGVLQARVGVPARRKQPGPQASGAVPSAGDRF